jgi:hypothetical protein
LLSPEARLPAVICGGLKVPGPSGNRISTRLWIAIMLNCHQIDRKSAS